MRNIIKILVWLSQRVVVFYILLVMLFMQFIDYESIQQKFRLATLNRIRPYHYHYLVDVADNKVPVDRKKMMTYFKYFNIISDFLPHKPGAHAMLGFLSFYLGNKDDAIKYYQKAVDKNAWIHMFHYNLGLVYFHEGRYEEAAQSLKATLNLKANVTFLFLVDSKIYRPILANVAKDNEKKVFETIRRDYDNSYRLIILSYYHLKKL